MEYSEVGARSFHDGWFEGMLIPNDKTVHLFVKTLDGQCFTMVLNGVEALHIWNVRAGNIILDMNMLDSAHAGAEDIESVYQLSNIEKDKQIARKLAFAKEAGLKILRMRASYGAECVAFFKTAELRKRTAVDNV